MKASNARLSYDELFRKYTQLEEELKEKCRKDDQEGDSIERLNNSGSWKLNLSTNIQSWSENYCHLLGYEKKIERPDNDLFLSHVYPDDLDMVKEAIQASMTKQESMELEFRYVPKDGTIKFAKSKAEFSFDENGSLTTIIGTFQDITKYKVSELSLMHSEEHCRKVFDNLSQGVFIQNIDYELVDVNPTALEIFGLTREQFIGKTSHDPGWEVIDENLQPLAPEAHPSVRALDSGKSIRDFILAVRNVDKNHFRWLLVNAIPQFNEEEDRAAYVIVSILDITERKVSSDVLETLAKDFAGISGLDFFHSSCSYIAKVLHVDIAFVGRLLEKEAAVQVIAGVDMGKPIEPFQYELPHTPCWNVVDGDVCFYPSDVQNLFPQDFLLIEMGIESYAGIPIRDKDGVVFGLLVLLHRGLMKDKEIYTNILHIFSSSMATEMDRSRYEREILEAKERAEQNELKFRALYDNSPDMFASVSPDDATLILCNNTFLKNTGYSRDEVIGSPVFKVYHDDCIDEARETFKKFAECGIVENKELILAKKNGEKIHVSLNVNSVKDKNGRILYSMSSWRDISARIELRVKQQRDQKLLNETGRLAKIGGWELDIKTMKSYYSVETKRIYGIPIDADPPMGTDGISYYPEEAQKALSSLINDAIEKAIPYDIELPFINEQGKHLWIRTIGIPELTNGKVTRLYGTFHDVSEQKIANEKIQLNENRLNALLELSRMTDKTNEYIYDFTLNKAIELTQSSIGFLGFVSEDEREVDIYKWSESAMKECAVRDKNMRFVVEEAGVWGDVLRQRNAVILNDYNKDIPNKKGLPTGHVPVMNYLSIPTFKNGKIRAIISIANKEADYSQSDINQLTLLLDGMYRFLDQKNEKDKLIEAKKKAEESDKLKSSFLANMSHEIRTPMNGILGFTNLLQSSDLSVENHRSYIEIIKKSGDRLLSTVNDIIEISKIESGVVDVVKTEIDVIAHLDTLIAFFRPEAEEKSLDIITKNSVDGDRLVIHTDKTKFSSILSNLIKNAIKYTETGSVHLGFKVENERLIYTCKDTGIGIPSHRREAIFNRFEQADIEDKRAHQGSGLGLAIVKSYVEMLDGEIWLESEEGKGTSFYVSLPFHSVNMEQTSILTKSSNTGSASDQIKILVAEDDEVSALHLHEVLSGISTQVSSVENGLQAVEALKNDSSIDLVLMDLKMPQMNGFEATRQIRAFNKDVIIIAQTAFAFEEDRQKSLAAGCNDYISKPIQKGQLVQMIGKYF